MNKKRRPQMDPFTDKVLERITPLLHKDGEEPTEVQCILRDAEIALWDLSSQIEDLELEAEEAQREIDEYEYEERKLLKALEHAEEISDPVSEAIRCGSGPVLAAILEDALRIALERHGPLGLETKAIEGLIRAL